MVASQSPEPIVVSGANGLVGKSVCQLLVEQGRDVIALVRPSDTRRPVRRCRYVEVDLTQPVAEQMQSIQRVSGVIHLAQSAGWHGFPRGAGQISRINVGATVDLAEFATSRGAASFTFTSSGGIFGAHAAPITETSPRRDTGELGYYLDTKVAAESLLGHFGDRLKVHILRPFFIYGPEQSGEFLITRLIKSAMVGQPIGVAEGTGPTINPIHVSDAAKAIIATLELETNLTSNVAGGEARSIKDIAEIVQSHLGTKVIFDDSGRLNGNYVADIKVMSRMLHVPEIELRDGIADMIENSPFVRSIQGN